MRKLSPILYEKDTKLEQMRYADMHGWPILEDEFDNTQRPFTVNTSQQARHRRELP